MTAAAKRKPKTKPVAKAASAKPKPRTKRKPREKPMTTPDKDDKAAADKAAKAAAEKRDHDKAPGHVDNRDQDPNHPANKTPSPERRAMPRSEAEAFGIPPEEMLTEQEKAAVGSGTSGDTTAGVGPANPAEHTTGPVETIADQGIGPRTPYPTGNPPPPDEQTTMAQGIKGVTDRPHNEPDKPLRKEPVK